MERREDDDEPDEDREDLTSKVISGTRWTAISSISMQVVRLVVQIILARLLMPEDFGVVAVAIVVINFLDIVMDLGTGVAIIQRKDLPPPLASAIFVVNAGIGVALFVLTVGAASSIARLFGTPQATSVIQVMAFALIITSLSRTQYAMLKRRMAFRSFAFVEIGGAVANAAVSIPLAVLGAGAWALVFGHLSAVLVSALIAYRVSGWLPTRPIDLRALREIASFSLNVVGYQLTRFALMNADKLVIGRFLGAAPLGVYAIAERFMKYPVMMLAQGVIDVLTPALSRTQDDREALARGALRAFGAVALITFPLMFGLATVAYDFTIVVLSARWLEAAPLIRILGPTGAILALIYVAQVILVALGRAEVLFRLTVAGGAANVAAYLIGVQWGLNGLAIAYAISVVLVAVPSIWIPLHLAGIHASRFAAVMAPYAVATIGLVIAAAVAGRAIGDVGELARLVSGVAAGAVAYGAALLALRPPALLDVARLVGLDRRLPRLFPKPEGDG